MDLGNHALSGCFPGPNDPDTQLAPLSLGRCKNCDLLQLFHDTDLEEMFSHDYGYRSSLNASMKVHLAELVGWARAIRPVLAGDSVLDIGANDGTLLANYDAEGISRTAIDPIIGKFIDDYPMEIETHECFFTKANAEALLKPSSLKIITSISMFYDLPDPSDFVAGIQYAFAEDGIWVLEQSYLPLMLERNAFDTICHEHLEYYAFAQIERLLENAGLRALDVQLNDCNGGSFRVTAAKKESAFKAAEDRLTSLRAAEKELALGTDQPYQDFIVRVEDIGKKLEAFLTEAKNANKKVYLYGASTKGNTLLQHYRLGTDLIAGALEVNPDKFGHRTPGTNIPILDEADIFELKPDYLLVLPWHFKDNILARSKHILDAGISFVFPLPNFEIVSRETDE